MLRFLLRKSATAPSAVNTVSRAVAAKLHPALEGILVGDDRLTMSGYNMQTGIRTAASRLRFTRRAASC